MTASRRRLSPDERRRELLALGAEAFGQRPYDEVRIDEIAERAGVSRALMYHYFPDKRAFFADVVRAEKERLFEMTNTLIQPGLTLFSQVRAGVLAYLRYDEEHPHRAWAAYMGTDRLDPVLHGIKDTDNERQATRIIGRLAWEVGAPLDAKVERDLRAAVHGWLAFALEMCRQRLLDSSVDVDFIADLCAHGLVDAIGRVPGIPSALAESVSAARR